MAPSIQEPIAVVGMACRFPGGSSSPSKLWELLHQPRDVLKEFDPERLNLKRFYHPNGDVHGSTDVRNKAYLVEEDTRLFDTAFFGISPFEASGMDPQQRLLLEVVYEAFESAGATLEELKGSLTSVHVGVMTADYANIQLRDLETVSKYVATGTANSILSNRVSYIFDLKGPSETIDTACSSSLVALHNATRGLLAGDCETAVVAGVNLIFDTASFINESKLHMLSPDGRSRMWNKDANGYARGEGVAALVLKPLSKAIRDGDHIEGVIRATGVNSDGQSPGITMPFAPTQADLIRHTYRRAGLDPVKDRPQYFECHGTGTQAGDPVEARAVSEALLRDEKGNAVATAEMPLYVGSIKTIIGHLEGCAGLAGVIKVLLAIKHRTIPPNLFFDESNINPKVAPFYGPMKIVTRPCPWPAVPAASALRASVNSFGFGGTNAHAIIESYEETPPIDDRKSDTASSTTPIIAPLLFSASSGSSLLSTVRAHFEHITANPSLDLSNLTWTLQTRRTTHRMRAYFSSSGTRDSLLASMSSWLATHTNLPSPSQIGSQPPVINPSEVPGILGVFTGQGAQWPTMGRALLHASPLFRTTLQKCEAVLHSSGLPNPSDAPTWSLIAELSAPPSHSRLSEAAISQPLCTAVQLALVDLLTASGIRFHAVVGHSSGEIAATYAAGIITLQGAMQIAYYRGLYARLACSPSSTPTNPIKGGMLAAGLTPEKAAALIAENGFAGRLSVAAHNGPQSVTLSGDLDAIMEAKERLDGHGIFARQLKVDTAYHSRHMQACAGPYLDALRACEIEVRRPGVGKPVWCSSVRGDVELLRRGELDSLRGQYWVDNMVKAVLFTEAVEASVWRGGPWDVAVEVGPHPALKGPVEQTIRRVFGGGGPVYAGVLKRGGDDVVAFGEAVGEIWRVVGGHMKGEGEVDWMGLRAAFGCGEGEVVKGLPGYAWDHDRVHWRESRTSRRYRVGAGGSEDGGHELLGRRDPGDNDRELRWRNVLKLSEMPYLKGHNVLDEVLLPAAAYVSIALEAGKRLADIKISGGKRPVRLLEVQDVEILRPLVVPDNTDGVETLFTVHLLDTLPNSLQARFSYYVYLNDDASGDTMMHTCSGLLTVHLDAGDDQRQGLSLPARKPSPPNLGGVDAEQIYSTFADLGLGYSGAFQAITESQRCLGFASATGTWPSTTLGDATTYVMHPAILDVAFQTAFIARAHPSTRTMTTAFLPAKIARVRVDPSASRLVQEQGETDTDFEAWVVDHTATSFTGDINIYRPMSQDTVLQVEGLLLRVVGEPDASQDKLLFGKTVWDRDVSAGLVDPVRDMVKDARAQHRTEMTERFALYYVKTLVDKISKEERKTFQWHHQRMFEAFEGRLATIRAGLNPVLPESWLDDDESFVDMLYDSYPDWVDLQVMRAVGESMPSVVKGETQLLEVMNKDDGLNRMYMNDLTFLINDAIAQVLRQITFKFPRCNILEIGAGTGATSWSVLNTIGDAYDSYTYTDISPGFFQNAATKFAAFSDRMIFKVLDAENDVGEQGFTPHSYDVVIAANVLHATRSLPTTLRNARSLLKPGGYLVLMETTGNHTISTHLIYGGLPGWWRSEEGPDDLRLGPVTTIRRWDSLLRETGFSGVDTSMHDLAESDKHKTSLIVSQAAGHEGDMLSRLQDPLSVIPELGPLSQAEPLVIVGGKRNWTLKTITKLRESFPGSWKGHVQTVGSIDELVTDHHQYMLTPGTNIICLQEADEPLFASTMTSQRMAALQNVLTSAKLLLWVTQAGRSPQSGLQASYDPRAAMIYAITRTSAIELPHLQIQALGLEFGAMDPTTAARYCLEAFIRLREAAVGQSDHDNDQGGVLWSHEPEVEILGNGHVLIPREMPDSSLNERYNASRRKVTKTVDATGNRTVAVQALVGPNNKMVLQEVDELSEPSSQETVNSRRIRIEVVYSLHIPAPRSDPNLPVYLVAGYYSNDRKNKTNTYPVMAISNVNASVVHVPSKSLIRLSEIDDDSSLASLLVDTANCMFAQSIGYLASEAAKHSSSHGNDGSVVLYGADESLAIEIAAELSRPGVTAQFLVSSDSINDAMMGIPETWTKIHPNATRRQVSETIPQDARVFVDCTYASGLSDSELLSKTIQECLPSNCSAISLDAKLLLAAAETQDNDSSQAGSLLLIAAYTQAMKSLRSPTVKKSPTTIPAASLPGTPITPLSSTTYLTSWQSSPTYPLPLTITIPPLLTPPTLFSPTKTYLMVGCAGGLGLSLCQWMIRSGGARHLIITSRNPSISPSVIASARRQYGATIHALAMDVSCPDSVHSAITRIRNSPDTYPPIGGVCNAAMVLNDRFLVDMTVDQLNATLAPKVLGTEYLDKEFGEDAGQQLEFFAVLSSSTCVIGNVGQANYSAANLFMTSLVARRRARGMAGSVVHIGHVADVGYVAREGRNRKGKGGRGRGLEEHFRKIRLMPLSETEVCLAFGEAVKGGRGGEGGCSAAEITMGLEHPRVPMGEGVTSVAWLNSPRLGHYLPFTASQQLAGQQQQGGGRGGGNGAGNDVRKAVEEAKTEEEAVAAVSGAFCARLETVLQLPANSAAENMRKPVIDLGIDSLVAVELRTWFIKELGADVPVVKILGGDTVLQLSTLATKKMLAKQMANTEKPKQLEGEKATVKPSVEEVKPPVSSQASTRASSSSRGTSGSTAESWTVVSNKGDNSSSDVETGTTTPDEKTTPGTPPRTIAEQPMSPSQSRIWLMCKQYLDTSAAHNTYNMVFHYRLRGPLSMARLRHALQVTIQHHDSLRMRFYERPSDGTPMQAVLATPRYDIKHMTNANEGDAEAEVAMFKSKKWDLEYGHTFGVTVFSRTSGNSEESHDLVFGYHHIIMDGIAWYLFTHDLDLAYRMQPLETTRSTSHLEYTAHQLSLAQSSGFETQLAYWANEFPQSSLPPKQPIPLLPEFSSGDKPSSTDDIRQIASQGTHHASHTLPPSTIASIKKISHHLKVSPFHFHLSILQLLLAAHTSQLDTHPGQDQDIVIGIVDGNRSNDPRFESLIGCLMNILPVRFRIPSSLSNNTDKQSFASLARAISKKALAAFANGGVPLEMILDRVGADSGLLRVLANYRTKSIGTRPLGGGDEGEVMELVSGKDAKDPYEISWGFIDLGEERGGVVQMTVLRGLYGEEGCKKLLEGYVGLLEGVLGGWEGSVVG